MKTLILLLFPLATSAQVCLTPMEVRRANVLLDERERLLDERRADSLEIVAYRGAFEASEAVRVNLERTVQEQAHGLDLADERERRLVDIIAKSGKVTKRRERLLWIVGTVAVLEGVVIGVAYGLR